MVIAFESRVADEVRSLGIPESKLQVWKVHDPWGGNPAEYDEVALEIRRRLATFRRASHEA
jgi:protein-tyrosine-phosphatase